MAGVNVRPGDASDLMEIARIQEASVGAARWYPADYLAYDLLVAHCAEKVIGFVAARRLAEAESEILNLAVDPAWRRQGVGRRLLCEMATRNPGDIFLEVRESNLAARSFYQALGFRELAARKEYYDSPRETAIVMKFHSC
jgi:ribosomal-protein-alanine N-acetyltransferase